MQIHEDRIERIPISGCWIWTGTTDANGYGKIGVNYKALLAHRVVYEAYKGAIPEGLHLLHSCDVPTCVNPEHLRPGTPADNAKDRQTRNRGRDMKGEASHFSKINEDMVRAIREDGRAGTTIAREYGISHQQIYYIKNRKSWSHI